tara:strand:+ start:4372 stop:4974 length:603 start_codon:yes stop_codon:yes gene_type:complete
MLDSIVRPIIDVPLTELSRHLVRIGISANLMTLLGLTMGLAAMIAIIYKSFYIGLVCIILNRLADGLDGAIARHTQLTDFGGFFDIVADFITYSGVIFAFAIALPEQQFWACFLIFSYIGPISSFLAYAIIAGKRNITTEQRGIKSFYYLGGICEGTETAMVMVTICLLPEYFASVCLFYGICCWITTAGRVYCAWSDFT